eukprot:6485424-Amphidinium_carterae.1
MYAPINGDLLCRRLRGLVLVSWAESSSREFKGWCRWHSQEAKVSTSACQQTFPLHRLPADFSTSSEHCLRVIFLWILCVTSCDSSLLNFTQVTVKFERPRISTSRGGHRLFANFQFEMPGPVPNFQCSTVAQCMLQQRHSMKL